MFTKTGRAIGSSAKVFGTAATTEELIKQNLDPTRDDSYVPIVGLASYVLPAVINKFTTPIPNKIVDDAISLADDWIPTTNKSIKKQIVQDIDGSTKVYEDGVLVSANKIDTAPSGVGAAVNTDVKNLSTAETKHAIELFISLAPLPIK